MRLNLLGTGNALVTECYNTCFVISDEKNGETRHLLVDGGGGNGILRRLIGHEVTFFDIRSTKARQFGFSMELDNEGRRLACCGDEPYAEHERPYAEGATWLLHEAFCLRSQADVFHPYEKCHSTVADACELAEGLGVENLVLYHTEDRNIARRRELYLAEGAPLYRGNLYVPDDLEVIEL